MSVRHPLLTIGHSNLDVATFVGLLQVHDVSVVVDVRSSPFSRYMPEYNRDAIRATLEAAKIQYVFMGVELGARRTEPECYREGMARYDLIAKSPLFQRGLDRLREGTLNYRVALMCAEKDPLTCHRTILICRQLRTEFTIEHILDSGQIEPHEQAELRLLDLVGLPRRDLFRSQQELIDDAYDRQGEDIAYREPQTPAET